MSGGVYSHGSGALTRLYGLHNCKPSCACLADDGERAIPATGECLAIIAFRGVDTCAYRQVSQHLAVVGTHHNQFLWLAATNEQTSLLRVDHHSYGRTARGYGPTRDHLS